jgi:hypothetical protein
MYFNRQWVSKTFSIVSNINGVTGRPMMQLCKYYWWAVSQCWCGVVVRLIQAKRIADRNVIKVTQNFLCIVSLEGWERLGACHSLGQVLIMETNCYFVAIEDGVIMFCQLGTLRAFASLVPLLKFLVLSRSEGRRLCRVALLFFCTIIFSSCISVVTDCRTLIVFSVFALIWVLLHWWFFSCR